MKQRFIFILLFFWIFHFIFPLFGYLFYREFINLYSNVQSYDGMIVNTIVILLTISIVYFLPSKKYSTFSTVKHAESFFIISLIISGCKFIMNNGYAGALKGIANGTFISYLSLFFRLDIAFFLMFCLEKKIKKIFFYILLYVAFFTFTGSRSAIIMVFFLYLYLPFFYYRKPIFNRLKKIILLFAVISPLLFVYATLVRGNFDIKTTGKYIIGRISMIELSSIPIVQNDNQNMDVLAFHEKYSINNQIKQSLNAISPIDFFEYDVSPNQYFRSVFLGAPESYVVSNYMSVNMTLPIYFVLISNKIIGVIISVIFLVSLYLFWYKFSNNKYIFFMIFFSIYEILYFFDFVMIIQGMLAIVLTLFTLEKYELVLNVFVTGVRRYFTNNNKSLAKAGRTNEIPSINNYSHI